MKKFRERTFVLGRWCWSCVFWWVFAYALAFCFGGSLPKVFGKFFLMSGLLFFGFGLSFFGFFVDVVFFCFFKRYRSSSNRTPPHALVCLFFLSRRTCCFALFGRASCFSALFSGCHSGPRAFLGFSSNLRGLSSLAPSEASFSWDARRQGFLGVSLVCFCFSPFVLFCGRTLFLKGPPRDLAEAGAGDLARPLARVRARGCPI